MNTISLADLHCDTITLALEQGKHLRENDLHISLSKLPKGSEWLQAFAIFMPDKYRGQAAIDYYETCLAYYRQELAANPSLIGGVTTIADMEQVVDVEKRFAALLTVEGGSALAGDLARVEKLRKDGVRMLTLTWNGENEIASGSDTSYGFTPLGVEMVGEMERQGIIVDVSHLNDQGFKELCQFAQKPFIASHSNARSVCSHLRNLTDRQICEIRDRKGLIGINYYRNFLVDGGVCKNMDDLLCHIDYILKLGGEDILALGSDFDGADVPHYINGLDQVENLWEALFEIYDETFAEKLFYKNTVNFFKNNL